MTLASFADIPAEVARRVAAGERVLLVLLDALGLHLLQREADHPLHGRLDVTPLRSQFPSTTTAHVTTAHFGVPVEVHGLYEWRVLEPSLGEVIVPLRFHRDAEATPDAGPDVTPDDLAARLDPARLAPGPTVYETLDGESLVAEPTGIGGPYDRIATAGATRLAFDTLDEGLEGVAAAFADPGRDLRYAYLYWGEIDRLGHHHGPSSPEFRAAARAALDAVQSVADRLHRAGVTVLLTADHGQVDVSPDRVDRLDELWPALAQRLTHRLAGSSRDAFLHVVPGEVGAVLDGLADRLGDRARVTRAIDLFPDAGPRLIARLGDVAVLPAPGRQVWLAATPSVETWNLGQHGGMTGDETATYLARLDPSPARSAPATTSRARPR